MTATDKIERAINSYDDRRKGRLPAIAAARGAPTTLKALSDLAASMRTKRKRHREYREAVTAHMAKWRAQRETALVSLKPKVRAEVIATEEKTERAMAIGLYKDERGEIYGEIQNAHSLAQATARLFGDSVAYLDTQTLGNGKRSVYDRQLAYAGAAALADAMLKAAATGDAELFAAANAKAGTLPKGQKDSLADRIDVRATANLLAADDLRTAAGAISALKFFAAEAGYETAKLEGISTNADDRINLGLLRREVESTAPDLLTDPEGDDPAAIPPGSDPRFASAPRGTFSP